MVNLISKLYIKESDSENIKRSKYGIICGVVGIFLNLVLTATKILSGCLINSIALVADGINNLSDATSSLVTFIGFKMSNKQADEEHPFGHGRIEYVSGLIVAILIVFMGFELFKTSIQKLFTHADGISQNIIIYILLVLSILVKFYMHIYNKSIGNKINSETLKAAASDSLSDMLATSIILISTILSKYTSFNIDAICGTLVSAFILFTGIKTCNDTISPLIGRAADEELKKSIKGIVLKNKKILGVHDLIVHEYGSNNLLVTLHAEVSSKEKLVEIHNIIDNIERKLKKELNCIATIHIDPVDIENPMIYEASEKIVEKIKEYIDKEASIHDFRMISKSSKTKLLFDLEVPYSLDMNESTIIKKVIEIIKDIDEKYEAIFEIDRI